jgi:Protein of unknown function (DUF3037)
MPYDYAVLRAVPRVDRGECVNVGVVLYCQGADFLGAAVELDAGRLLTLDPHVDVEGVRAALDALGAVCRGEAATGPAAAGSRRERFGWLTAPRSTVVQAGPVHGGMTTDPPAELERLLDRLVRLRPG